MPGARTLDLLSDCLYLSSLVIYGHCRKRNAVGHPATGTLRLWSVPFATRCFETTTLFSGIFTLTQAKKILSADTAMPSLHEKTN